MNILQLVSTQQEVETEFHKTVLAPFESLASIHAASTFPISTSTVPKDISLPAPLPIQTMPQILPSMLQHFEANGPAMHDPCAPYAATKHRLLPKQALPYSPQQAYKPSAHDAFVYRYAPRHYHQYAPRHYPLNIASAPVKQGGVAPGTPISSNAETFQQSINDKVTVYGRHSRDNIFDTPPLTATSAVFDEGRRTSDSDAPSELRFSILADAALDSVAKTQLHNASSTSQPESYEFSLSRDDVKRLLSSARSNKNPTKALRDYAMVCILLDLKFACQRIADLTYRDVQGILSNNFIGIYRYTDERPTAAPTKAIKCQQRTADAIKAWTEECDRAFGWKFEPLAPLFVPLAFYGDHKYPKRLPLKRDAISKVFSSIKAASGVQMNKEMINRTVF